MTPSPHDAGRALECPCGSESVTQIQSGSRWHLECDICDRRSRSELQRSDAIKAWNNRTFILGDAGRALADELRWCGYCESWNNKPCGQQCHWLPTDPTLEQMTALRSPVLPAGSEVRLERLIERYVGHWLKEPRADV